MTCTFFVFKAQHKLSDQKNERVRDLLPSNGRRRFQAGKRGLLIRLICTFLASTGLMKQSRFLGRNVFLCHVPFVKGVDTKPSSYSYRTKLHHVANVQASKSFDWFTTFENSKHNSPAHCSATASPNVSRHQIDLVGHDVLLRPVALVGGVVAQIRHVAGVQARKPLDLVREARVLVARLHQLAPHGMEALVQLLLPQPVLLAGALPRRQHLDMTSCFHLLNGRKTNVGEDRVLQVFFMRGGPLVG
jgi:hypothetical protein